MRQNGLRGSLISLANFTYPSGESAAPIARARPSPPAPRPARLLAPAGAAPLPLPPWLAFLLALAGLAAVELMNLFGSDYVLHLSRRPARGEALWLRAIPPPGPVLPGTPVLEPRLLPPERIPCVLLPLALAGAAAPQNAS